MDDEISDYINKSHADLKHEFPGLEFVTIAYDPNAVGGFLVIYTGTRSRLHSTVKELAASFELRLHDAHNIAQ